MFAHPERDVWVLVHGDDYACSGFKQDLRWLESEMNKVYEIKVQHVGPNSQGFSEGNVLNRIVRWRGYCFCTWEMYPFRREALRFLRRLERPATCASQRA